MDSPADPNSASRDDSNLDKTLPVAVPSPSVLIHENAGRILGEMLGAGIPGVECAGDNIGPYRLCELLGEGGFGNVWRAEQTEVVRREVAVKVIKLGMDTAQVLSRFNQERQALASLDHPHIATMLDAGMSPDGRPYFAMELVRGESITRWCVSHHASLHERLRLFIQVCQAVQHAHCKGILHRDLKPANVLVTEIDGRPAPKIIDFGIAKAVSSSSFGDLSLLTQTGQVIGTPLYMSPEQIEGGQELDARSDVYALGVLLYELLTGLPPFDLTALSSSAVAAMKRLILDTVPERPSARLHHLGSGSSALRPLLADLPSDLDWITLQALEKDRLRRYPSAAEFATDVQRHLDHQPVQACPPSFRYRAGRWIQRRRKAIAAGSLGAALTAGLLFATLQLAGDSRESSPLLSPPLPLAADGSFTNSLGMKFVPVPDTDVLFCIHETRYKDYASYSPPSGIQTPHVDPPLDSRGDFPVARVGWEGARDFCKWLSRKEGRTYRLPTDHEWSCAAGIGKEEKWTPESTPKSVLKNITAYPWGDTWPPPEGAGNYLDLTRKEDRPDEPTQFLAGYRDGFAIAAPVMSFKPNRLGLYDMGGNVMEWVADWWDDTKKSRVLRGGGWDYPNDNFRETLLSSNRVVLPYSSDFQHPLYGFRCVLETKPAAASRLLPTPSPAPPISHLPRSKFPTTTALADSAKDSSTNSLGMKLLAP